MQGNRLLFYVDFRRRPERLWRERGKTFISLEEAYAVSGPYRFTTPAMLGQILIA